MNKLLIVIIPAILLISTFTTHAEQGAAIQEGMKPYTPTRLEWLAVELNASNRTDAYGLEGYALSFIPLEKENTILIYVLYSEYTNRQAMNIGIKAAHEVIESNLKSRGWDSWIKVRERIEMVDRAKLERTKAELGLSPNSKH